MPGRIKFQLFATLVLKSFYEINFSCHPLVSASLTSALKVIQVENI